MPTRRCQFDFSDSVIDCIERVKKRIDAGSRAEVVRRAVKLLDYATDEDVDVVIKYPDGAEHKIISL